MRAREVNPSIRLLVLLAIISLGIFYLAEATRHKKQAPYYDLKFKAATLDKKCQGLIHDELKKRGIAIDFENDPNGSGLIGEQSTLITTDLGDLRSKLVSTNPNFAAAFVEMFKECNLKRGDRIAAAITGSFPGVNIAFYSACEVMDLQPVVITSLGSSTWGANNPDFTWLDMEKLLYDAKVISNRSVAASLGGGTDNGRGLSLTGRRLLLDAIRRNNVELIFTGNLEDILQGTGSLRQNIDLRMKIYENQTKGQSYAAYVNIGGSLASLGSSQNGKLLPSGVNLRLIQANFPARGVINIMAERKIPIIHVMQPIDIADAYGLSVETTPAPEAGKDPIFQRDEYSITSTIIYTILLMIIVAVFIRIDVKYYVRRQTKILFPPRSGEDPEL
ncbi:MAG TPA: poly-gamma-glutamate system protein [candidate division Zixibacteria bacterium]|nr:poly-gamma-glutamate system protein [candidate division Zixibacteria bacterium]